MTLPNERHQPDRSPQAARSECERIRLGCGGRGEALGTGGAETTGMQWQVGEDGVSECGPDSPLQHQQSPLSPVAITRRAR